MPVHHELTDLYWCAVGGVAPKRALRAALQTVASDAGAPVRVIAIGKAAAEMALCAIDHLREHGGEPRGGIVIAPSVTPSPHPALVSAVGDHPVPEGRSLAAADALGEALERVEPAELWLLLSGGASSLAAAPAGGISQEELGALFRLLLGAGLDIATMNTIRKRFLRWGAGRVAVAAAGARIRGFVMSDVPGDELSAIGSGPCVPDHTTASDIRALLERFALWSRVPPSVRTHLLAAEHDASLETPKPGDAAFDRVEHQIVASNRHALEAAAACARELGMDARIAGTVDGDAAGEGRRIANALIDESRRATARPRCFLWGGETTVTIGPEGAPPGGRCQELALACAGELHRRRAGAGIALLAAGTDGRDGDTDAAGAVVHAGTWARIAAAGRDPARDLEGHASHAALEAAGALLRTDLTGTNVMDVVIGICGATDPLD